MKQPLLAFLVVCLLLAGCSSNSFNDGYESGYNAGYEDAEFELSSAYRDILFDGAYEIIRDFAFNVESEFEYNVVRETSRKYDLHPEEAIIILNDFKDGKHVTADELYLAIDVVTDFYYECDSFIYDIEKIEFDVDLD